MEAQYLVWVALIAAGALLGAFLRLAVVGWVVFALVSSAFVGGFGAAFLQVLQPE